MWHFLLLASLLGCLPYITTQPADCPQLKLIIPACDCISDIDRPNAIVIYCKAKSLTSIPVINGSYEGVIYEFTLADNDITYLPDNAFKDLNIQQVDLSNNKLRNISEQAFQGLGSMLKVLKLSGDAADRSVAPFSAIKTLFDLEELMLQNFLSPSPDLENSTYFQPFTKLLKLTLDNLEINSIGSNAFVGLSSLKEITIKHSLRTYPGGALMKLHGTAEKISITNTQITAIQQYSFDGFRNLTNLDFSYNQINKLEVNCFIGIENLLQSLRLDNNPIPVDQLREVKKLSALQVLSLQSIGLDNLAQNPGLFNNNTNLLELKLAGNRLTNIPNNAFKNLYSLKTLELSQNQIQTMEDNALSGLTSLEKLNLDSQVGSELSLPLMSSLPALATLILDHTVISSQSWSKLSQARSLITLRMQQCQIAAVPPLTFQMMTNLQYLDLSANSISDINQNTFVGPRNSLKTIHMNQNRIATFDSCTFYNYSGNVSLEFYGNPLRCDCGLYWLKTALDDRKIILNLLTTCFYPSDLNGTAFKSLEHSELCQTTPDQPRCEDSYSTTTSTTSAPTTTTQATVQITVVATEINLNSITISWTISMPKAIDHVIVVHTDLQTQENVESREFEPTPTTEYTVGNLKSGRRYQFCVDAYKTNTIIAKQCGSYTTKSLTSTPDPSIGNQTSNNNELGIIIGSVIGGLVLFGILVAIIYLMFVRKKTPKVKYAVEPKTFTRAELPTVGYDSKRYRKKKKKDDTDGNKNNVNVTVISDGKAHPNVGRASVGSYQYLQDNKGVSDQPNPGYVNDAAPKMADSAYENDQSMRPLPQMPLDSAGYYNPSFRNSTADQQPHAYSEINL